MRGRYPAGLEECVEELDGAPEEKQRLQIILDTVLGDARLFESCTTLGLGETRFRQLRQLALQGALDGIKPKPPGRPSRATTPERVGELERLLAEKEQQLRQALVREEVALILTKVGDQAAKKTPRPSVKLRKQKPR
jgi:hypothetical protein